MVDIPKSDIDKKALAEEGCEVIARISHHIHAGRLSAEEIPQARMLTDNMLFLCERALRKTEDPNIHAMVETMATALKQCKAALNQQWKTKRRRAIYAEQSDYSRKIDTSIVTDEELH